MIKQLKIIAELSEFPFLLFQERICIYDSDFQDYDLIQRFSELYWDQTPEETMTLHPLEELIFASVKFIVNRQTYVFSFVYDANIMDNWSADNVSELLSKAQAIIIILSETTQLTLSTSQFSNPLFSNFEKNDVKKKEGITGEDIDFSDNYQFEKAFIHQLKNGDVDTLRKMITRMSSINRTRLSDDKIVEMKYRVVALITMITRSSIEYGCPPALAYRLSDQLIRRMDKIKTANEFPEFSKQMTTEFCLLIQTESIPQTSLIVKQAAQYINHNLYEPLSLELIAEMVGVHPSYLSTIFKKTLAISLSQYINKVRVEEAKYLLTQTDFSFMHISEMLHFSSQSYFGKVFKNTTGYTPKEYQLAN